MKVKLTNQIGGPLTTWIEVASCNCDQLAGENCEICEMEPDE